MSIMKSPNWRNAAATTLVALGLVGFSACNRSSGPQIPKAKPQNDWIRTVEAPTERFSQKELDRVRPVSYNVLARHLRSADVLLFSDFHDVPERAEAMGRLSPLLARMGFHNLVMGDLSAGMQSTVMDEFNKTGHLSYALADSLLRLKEFPGCSSPERSSRGALWGVLKNARAAGLRLITPGRWATKQEEERWSDSYRAYDSDVNSMVARSVLFMYRKSMHKKSAVFIGQAHIEGIRALLEKEGLRVKVVRLATMPEHYDMVDSIGPSGVAETEEQILYNGYSKSLDAYARSLDSNSAFGKLVFWPAPDRLIDRPCDAVIFNPSLTWNLVEYLQELKTAYWGKELEY